MGSDVVVVVGVGGMGGPLARRLGPGRTVLLADFSADLLAATAEALAGEGHTVETQQLDVSDAASVAALAARADGLGPVRTLIHTAGVSPVQAPADRVMAVDLLGAALVLDAFGEVMAPGGAGVVISSMSAALVGSLGAEVEAAIATTPTDGLLAIPAVAEMAAGDPGFAYAFAKRAVQILVAKASVPWGRRGARVNSISPGVIATSMGQAELDGPHGEGMRAMVAMSGTARLGTPDDIAAAAEFLVSERASFITGTDLLVDGGVVAAVRTPTA